MLCVSETPYTLTLKFRIFNLEGAEIGEPLFQLLQFHYDERAPKSPPGPSAPKSQEKTQNPL